MTFGPQVCPEESQSMLKSFVDSGHVEVDTAHVYNSGSTETILGEILPQLPRSSYSLATKVHPRITGRLDRNGIITQFEESLQRLQKDSVDILYLHLPDSRTPLEETLEICSELHAAGKFGELGLSNYPAWEVVHICNLSHANGGISPTVYQGMYNALTRRVEDELFPALREYGLRFYAFNPLAGGMLTGKHRNFSDQPSAGRFARLESYRNRYWKESYFEAVDRFCALCAEEEVYPAEAALRWLSNHSYLEKNKGDAIIIGASSLEQMNVNIESSQQGILPTSLRDAIDEAWKEVRGDCPPYFHHYPD